MKTPIYPGEDNQQNEGSRKRKTFLKYIYKKAAMCQPRQSSDEGWWNNMEGQNRQRAWYDSPGLRLLGAPR